MRPNTTTLLALSAYDKIIISLSGGKDSVALLLFMLISGVPPEKIELWHQLVDGKGLPFMDWEITESYCRAIARAFGVKILFQWKEGGFKREMLRQNALTAPTTFELLDGLTKTVGGDRGDYSTRLKFPQTSSDLSVRWCSSYLKIDVAKKVFTNDPRFASGAFLFITGERREESPARAKYAQLEKASGSSQNRRVDHYRAIIDWSEHQVWEIIKAFRVNPHPVYQMLGRVSCKKCIFSLDHQWALMEKIDNNGFHQIANYEKQFGFTIARKLSVIEQAKKGESKIPIEIDWDAVKLATSFYYPPELIFVDQWKLPKGAFMATGGPT